MTKNTCEHEWDESENIDSFTDVIDLNVEFIQIQVKCCKCGKLGVTLPTAGYCKGSPCNEKRNLISMNWIFCAKLVNRMKQESVRLLLHPIHLH